ncbi:4-hydroxy-tetrahydrodipicolinate synthase [Azotosporobacter soli]|uniref:4-hydroxy-tetrahydrodipicolinate synthase n=1 Tax=Azotosporobacter soli TaxID=3055040 RepID=UPI0031FE4EFB
MRDFGRVLTAMVTPFTQSGDVDYAAAEKLALRLLERGSDGLVVGGSTGEAATLSKEEKLKLFKVVLDAVGERGCVIAGTGSNDTRQSIEMTQAAEAIGVHGAMLVGPYYNKPTQEGFYQHFKAIADNSSLPLLLYNVPGRTASNIMPSTIARLAKLPNIKALKESSGNLEQITEIRSLTPPEFKIYSGDDSLTLPILAVGGIGIISVAAHVVGLQIKEMVQAFFQGEIEKAQSINCKLLPVFKAMFVCTNPIPVKTAVHWLGGCEEVFRLPLIQANETEKDVIRKAMRQAGLLK